MSRDHHDLLMDQLLREILGGDRPRDLTARVLARARNYDKVRRHWWAGTGSAIAAAIAIAFTLWMLWPSEYPAIRVEDGIVDISNQTQSLQRGSRISTPDDTSATIALGGYVNIEMAPKTIMTIGGSRFSEKVILEQGILDVSVAKSRGQFDVSVGRANVHVTGTKFQLRIAEQEEGERRVKRLDIAVREGSVVVALDHGPSVTLAANSPIKEKSFELSSEPTRVERVVTVPEQTRPGARVGAMRGAAAGAGEGGRPGLIAPNFITTSRPAPGTSAPPPLANRANTGRAGPGAVNTPRGTTIMPSRTVQMQVITSQGQVEMIGTLRSEGRDIYYLETENGPVLIFAQQVPTGPTRAFNSSLNKRVRVTWNDGKFGGITPVEPVPPSGTY